MKVSDDARNLVERRAQGACEYCLLPHDASILPHQVDHIIGRQHRGSDEIDNLCLCCIRCNLKKGPNIASVDSQTGLVVALYHPRRQSWLEHFAFAANGLLKGMTPEGRATVELLGMNDEDRVRLRVQLIRRGRYP